MDRLISLEPSNVVAIRVEPGQRCSGQLTLRNVMYTMPVAFRLQPTNKARYNVVPQSGIILPLTTLTLEITYNLPPNSSLPHRFPFCDDSFVLQSVVAPGASIKNPPSTYDSVPSEWFTNKKKQVYSDSGIKIMFVGSSILSHLVAKGYDMDEIREVLEKSDPAWKSADSVDSDGQSLLHLAIAQGRPELVQLLLEFGPDVEARNGHVEVLRHLLLKGANVNARTKDGKTALHMAVEERRRDCARLLLANGARADIQNASDGETPLHVASFLGDEQMVKLLLHKGANKDVRNKSGKTAYDLAAENGHTKLFDALRLGDNLAVAARKGEVRTIIRLLENGASINGQDQNGWTALHRAAFKGRMDAARALIEKGIDVNAKDEDGYTALHCAAESGQADVIELLVKKGAEIEARTNKGVTALQIAESLQYSGIIRILVHGGGVRDGSKQNLDQFTAKGVAGREKDIGMIKKKSRIHRSSFDRSVPLAVV
ncbi:UNVERIFIED_CONTAM: hypothetical protein Slati_2839100 [Sesamum latifolium]|uniref:MSP domain-containing protein n=1 Tax=Sesamum latifolium TaxID=2727402 RepID=A0AAW2VBT9_9LAMI